MKILNSYVPFLVAFVIGILAYDSMPWVYAVPVLSLGFIYSRRSFLYALTWTCMVLAGVFLCHYRESEFFNHSKNVSTYLKQKASIEGIVITHPVPSKGQYTFVVRAKKIRLSSGDYYQDFRLQMTSKSYQAPEKGDLISFETKLYMPSNAKNFQKIRDIQAYGMIHGDKNWNLIQPANLYSTKFRRIIFDAAQKHLSSASYAYYRAMVFGDQAMLPEKVMTRLKETGLLHLFVISGSHIAFACGIGLWLLRFCFLWIPFFHRMKNFNIMVGVGSILTVMMFLELINPPISTFRAVGSMILFLLLAVIKRNQYALWNLGIVFFATIIYNPLYLFDVSTQLTFASVAGLICGYHMSYRWTQESGWWKTQMIRITATSIGAGLFTLPILYFHFGKFYMLSFAYNLILGTTLGTVISFLAVASLIWTIIPYELIHEFMFGILDRLFLLFEKIIFWKPDFGMSYASSLDLTGISKGWILIGLGLLGMAFIIARHFSKETTEF